jgi:hypothetical protein
MSVEAAALSLEQPKSYHGILWGGLIAGLMDITAACTTSAIQRGRSPIFVLQSVASGLLGPESFKGGFRSAAVGLTVHFFIAFVACTVFYLISRKLRFLLQRPVVFGVLYGVVVYLFMYGVVLRLTFHRNFFQPPSSVVIAVLTHMICVGLPISLMVSRYSKFSNDN